MKAKTKEMVLVGVVEPGKVYHVPLHAIYSENKYLHFAIEVKQHPTNVSFYILNKILYNTGLSHFSSGY